MALPDLVDAPWYKAVAALPGLFMKGIGIGDLFAVKKGLDQIDPSLPIGPILDNFETAISLPEYLPDEKEMEILLAAILEHLASGRITPLVITISRSVRGGFTPPDVCETYERKLLKGLSSVLGNIIVQYDL